MTVNNCSKLFSFSDKMSFFVTLNFAFCCLSWSHTFLLSVKNLMKQPNYQNLNCYSGMLEPDLPLEPPISGRSVNSRTIRDLWLILFQPGGIFLAKCAGSIASVCTVRYTESVLFNMARAFMNSIFMFHKTWNATLLFQLWFFCKVHHITYFAQVWLYSFMKYWKLKNTFRRTCVLSSMVRAFMNCIFYVSHKFKIQRCFFSFIFL